MSDSVAAIALVVSLVALILALLQVLQQYTATADGFRRCQASVMGDWAALTKRRFRMSELRFETVFAVPVIFLKNSTKETAPFHSRPTITIDGTAESIRATFMSHAVAAGPLSSKLAPGETTASETAPSGSVRRALSRLWKAKNPMNPFSNWQSDFGAMTIDNDLVSWNHLLTTLQLSERTFANYINAEFGPNLEPAIQISNRSWDFVPPEVVRPYAVTTAGDIAIIVQRLGMSWKDFKPGEGLLRAEGNNCLITSTVVRSLGILISFSADWHLINDYENRGNIYVPSWQASMLGFGLVPYCGLPSWIYSVGSLRVGDPALFDNLLHRYCFLFTPEDPKPEHLRPQALSVASEFVALVAPVLRMRNSGITRILKPAPNIGNEVFSSQTCLEAFRKCLAEFQASPNPTQIVLTPVYRDVLKKCDEILLHDWWTTMLGAPVGINFNEANEELLNIIHDSCDWATQRLSTCVHFEALLRAHLLELFALRDENPDIVLTPDPDAVLMDLYFNRVLPKVQDQTNSSEKLNAADWVLMVFRGLCWYNLHRFKHEFAPVNEQYFESKQPIYIG
ncbi:hypothetical protein LTR47_000075 [Exophiala xenobiotica]|nr:hypothetical protein LTR47_000075 [Exophiala xenobiotica]KAK5252688.1 hypothetical protein LTS06_002865 [Exophiala xenobiotica]KAK5261263.1 hypothetical protein LTR40_002570 [Exophiala xenobiotica]KAK5349942.1 hypothetical protein LTR61_006648 [Exophiala xenobiotica]KAK5387139.1 hypothetical protein LTR11_000804 [Exophiala xenobiotica]